jgi:hypothetical protein
MRHVIVPLLFLLIASSCTRTYKCSYQTFAPVFVGYKLNEVDTLTLKTYVKGSGFAQLVRSEILTSKDVRYTQNADSIDVFSLSVIMSSLYDFELINAFDNKIVKISDVVWKEEEGVSKFWGGNGGNCISPVTSYKRDNSIINVINPGGSVFNLYIHK